MINDKIKRSIILNNWILEKLVKRTSTYCLFKAALELSFRTSLVPK